MLCVSFASCFIVTCSLALLGLIVSPWTRPGLHMTKAQTVHSRRTFAHRFAHRYMCIAFYSRRCAQSSRLALSSMAVVADVIDRSRREIRFVFYASSLRAITDQATIIDRRLGLSLRLVVSSLTIVADGLDRSYSLTKSLGFGTCARAQQPLKF